MGSRFKISKESEIAYIAGFLDGDGSLMLQLKKRSDSNRGIRFMATICFYQDTRHEKNLHWIKKVLNAGYFSKRNDGMSELRINGFEKVEEILTLLIPYIRFKKIQARALQKACKKLSGVKFSALSEKDLVQIVDLILLIQNENYVTKRKRSKNELLRILSLTP